MGIRHFNEDYLYDFNKFTSYLVSYRLTENPNITQEKLAEGLGLTVSFVKNALSDKQHQHFNLRHIFLIADILDISVDALIPSMENYKLLRNEELSEEEWRDFIHKTKNTED